MPLFAWQNAVGLLEVSTAWMQSSTQSAGAHQRLDGPGDGAGEGVGDGPEHGKQYSAVPPAW